MIWVLSFFTILFIPTALRLITLAIVGVLLAIILFVQLSIMVRRMHDLSYSDYWLLVIVPIYLFSISTLETTQDDSLLLFASVGAILILLVVALLAFKRGAKGPNKFGEDPLT